MLIKKMRAKVDAASAAAAAAPETGAAGIDKALKGLQAAIAKTAAKCKALQEEASDPGNVKALLVNLAAQLGV